MKHLKLILFSQLLSAISVAILSSLWYAFVDNENIGGKIIVIFMYALVGIPILVFIIAYHFSLIYLEKKGIRMSFIKKLLLMIILSVFCCLILLAVNVFSYSLQHSITLLGGMVLLAIHTALIYECACYIRKQVHNK